MLKRYMFLVGAAIILILVCIILFNRDILHIQNLMQNILGEKKTEIFERKNNSEAIFSFTIVSVEKPIHPPVEPGYYVPVGVRITLDRVYKGKISNPINSQIEFISKMYFGQFRERPAGLWVGVADEDTVPKPGDRFIAFYKKNNPSLSVTSLNVEDIVKDIAYDTVLYPFSKDVDELLSGSTNSLWQKNVEYSGSSSKEEVISIVDMSLKKNGNLGAYGDLTKGIQDILAFNGVRLTDTGDSIGVEIYPLSQAGHDFSMRINKKTLEISNVVVGEVAPMPSF